jgi:ethanolamine ammonia-lyase large subunit
MTSTFILGALLGLAVGLLICYWNKAKAVYENKDKITAVSGLADALSNVGKAF